MFFVFHGPSLLEGHALGNGAIAVVLFAAAIALVVAVTPRVIFVDRPLVHAGS